MTDLHTANPAVAPPPADPLDLVAAWLAEAEAANFPQPTPLALATATPDGQPSNRMLLLEQFDRRGFVFSSSRHSRKGHDLAVNPRAELILYWADPLNRQIRARGPVQLCSRSEAEAVFAKLERGYQLLAHFPQGEHVTDRLALKQRLAKLEAAYLDTVPLPDRWASYRLVPDVLEFWEQRADRLNQRLRHRRGPGGGWGCEQLVP